MTQPRDPHLDTLVEIRALMERSSRFISLSGLSGVAAGLCAMLGAAAAFYYLGLKPFQSTGAYYPIKESFRWSMSPFTFFALDAALVLLGALAGGLFFTNRKATRKGQKVWDAVTKRLLINLALPLVTGGIFCLALLRHGAIEMIAPATLVFYGLALINASKYTFNDIRNLGISEVVLGLIAMFVPGFGLECWTIGFGVLHIIYGILMYNKYEAPGRA